jgi:hypothetical protein
VTGREAVRSTSSPYWTATVDYVVIGAFAAIAQGAPLEATHDIDLTPGRSADNLGRLSVALSELGARLRVEEIEKGLVFSLDAGSLAPERRRPPG